MNNFIMSGGNSVYELNFGIELDLNQQSKTRYHTTHGKSPFGFKCRQQTLFYMYELERDSKDQTPLVN